MIAKIRNRALSRLLPVLLASAPARYRKGDDSRAVRLRAGSPSAVPPNFDESCIITEKNASRFEWSVT